MATTTTATAQQIDINHFYPFGDRGDAELFARFYQDLAIFDHSAEKWFIWQGNYWTADNTKDVYRLFDKIPNFYLTAAATPGVTIDRRDLAKRAGHLMTLNVMRDVLHLATSLPELKTDGNAWDENPMILPAGNGVIDLATGTLRNGSPREYIRKHTDITWEGIDAPAPLWEKAISEIMQDDTEMVEFLQRLFGYMLTGKTTEHILPVFWGKGRNGKGLILETIAYVLGDEFTSSAPFSEFVQSSKSENKGAGNPFLYGLNGKRLIWVSEPAEGARLDLARVKLLTGGDSITARTLFQREMVTFQPTHKIILITNHLPKVDADDDAAWERILTVEFGAHFTDNPTAKNDRLKDRNLPEKLKAEASGILAWLVRGCLMWQAEGLNPPAKVRKFTQAYRDGEDDFTAFCDECLQDAPGAKLASMAAFKSYQSWAIMNGVDVMTVRKFGAKMTARYGNPVRVTAGMMYQNVKTM